MDDVSLVLTFSVIHCLSWRVRPRKYADTSAVATLEAITMTVDAGEPDSSRSMHNVIANAIRITFISGSRTVLANALIDNPIMRRKRSSLAASVTKYSTISM